MNPSELKTCDLLILGSPTHGGFPTESIYGLLKALLALEGVSVAAFDTRTKTTIFGYAAPKIAKALQRNGANLLVPPEGFLVLGMHGPLKDGELERAKKWTQHLPLANEVPAATGSCPHSQRSAAKAIARVREGEKLCSIKEIQPNKATSYE